MIPPALAAWRFAAACLYGLGLGLFYDVLRPLRRRRNWFWDLVFVAGVWYAWLYHSFAVCRGDIRLGLSLGLGAGFLLWETTASRLLRPLISHFWAFVFRILEKMWYPGKKILQKAVFFSKKGLAFGKKWGTIGWNRYRKKGAKRHGTEAKDKAEGAKAQPCDDRGHRAGAGAVHGGSADGAKRHPRKARRDRRSARSGLHRGTAV